MFSDWQGLDSTSSVANVKENYLTSSGFLLDDLKQITNTRLVELQTWKSKVS